MAPIAQSAHCVGVSSLLWMAWLCPGWAESVQSLPAGDRSELGFQLEPGDPPAGFTIAAPAPAALSTPPIVLSATADSWQADSWQAADLLGSAPENLNPGLYVPPDPVPPTPPAEEAAPLESGAPFWQIETLTVDFRDDFNNFDQGRRFFEPTVTGRLANGDRLSFSTGLNTFTQPAVDQVLNIPLRAAWTRQMGDFTTTLGAGVDVFDRLPLALNLTASTTVPIGNSATLSLNLNQGPYKFNATSLQNQITAWRYGPDLFWQITPNTSLFSQLRLGNFNDGNWEQQSSTRLEQRLGEFTVAANLFNWSFSRDVEATNGYFSPPDFLVANAEVAWQGQVFSDVACRVAGTLGPQRLLGEWSLAYGYEALCTAQFDQIEVDLGYAFSTVAAGTGGSDYSNRSLRSQVRARF